MHLEDTSAKVRKKAWTDQNWVRLRLEGQIKIKGKREKGVNKIQSVDNKYRYRYLKISTISNFKNPLFRVIISEPKLLFSLF